MKLLSLFAAVVIVFIGTSTAFAQQRVTLEEVTPSWYEWSDPIIPVDLDVTFTIRVTNLNGLGCRYNFGGLFTISSPDGATWTTTILDTMPVFGKAMFDEFFFYSGSADGSGIDTVGLAAVWMGMNQNDALFDGFNDIAFSITISPDPSSQGKHICLDAITDPTGVPVGFEWMWSGLNLCMPIAPDWGGPYCFFVASPPCIPPMFSDAVPTNIRGPYCDFPGATFEAYWADPGSCSTDITYAIVDGPGQMDPMTGTWTWNDPSLASYVGQTVPLTIKACGNLICQRKTFFVSPTYGEVQFTDGCDLSVGVRSGTEIQVSFTADAVCPGATLSYFVADMDGATGPAVFDGNTLIYTPDLEGNFNWSIGATTDTDTAFCNLNLIVGECCGQFTGGYTGNVDCDPGGATNLADITRLIDRVYLSKHLLCCEENGNVDGDVTGTINMSDVTKLIDHIYLSKAPTASCQ